MRTTPNRVRRSARRLGVAAATGALAFGIAGPASAATEGPETTYVGTIAGGADGTRESYTHKKHTIPTQFDSACSARGEDEWGYQIRHSTYNANTGSRPNGVVWTTSTWHDFTHGMPPIAASSTLNAWDASNGNHLKSIKVPIYYNNGCKDAKVAAAFGLGVEDDTTLTAPGETARHRLWTSSTRDDRIVVYNANASGQIGALPAVTTPSTPTAITTGLPTGVVGVIDGVQHPRDILVDTANNLAYVSDPWGKLYVFNSTNFSLVTIVSAAKPYGATLGNFEPMSLDGDFGTGQSLVYTVNLNDGKVFEYDGLADSVAHIGDAGSGRKASGIALNPNRGTDGTVYIASQGGSNPARVTTIDISSGTATHQPMGAAQLNVDVDVNQEITPGTSRVYSAGFGGQGVPIMKPDGTAYDFGGGAPNQYLLWTNTSSGIARQPNDVRIIKGKIWVIDRQSNDAGLHIYTKP